VIRSANAPDARPWTEPSFDPNEISAHYYVFYVELGLILIGIVLVVAIPGAYLAWRFRQGDEAVPGGSDGDQLFGPTKDQLPR
jgi:hypothetical protein